jgi:radical SAM-linked protein
MSDAVPVQRIRVVFRKGEAVKYVSHLAVMRAWERIVRRAGLPIAHSHGFNPRPKLTFASALPVGATGRAEILDLELREPLAAEDVLTRLRRQMPPGLEVQSAEEVPLRAPALQAEMRYAVYEARLALEMDEENIRGRIDDLLAADHVLRQREIKDRVREYDLRALIHDAWYCGSTNDSHILGMALVNDNSAAGRPDEVLAALGCEEALQSVDRVRLVFRDQVDQLEAVKGSMSLPKPKTG